MNLALQQKNWELGIEKLGRKYYHRTIVEFISFSFNESTLIQYNINTIFSIIYLYSSTI